jgi:DNA invertase Pin-like site-specific DNA recombinase
MIVRIYVRASTKEQDAERALDDLVMFSKKYGDKYVPYVENHTGTKLERPELTKLLNESNNGDILLVESVDRLSRMKQDDFEKLKVILKDKGLRLVVADLPTTQIELKEGDDTTGSILELINKLLIDLLATMARLDNEKRKERIKQGLARSGYKPTGKKADDEKHKQILDLSEHGNLTKDQIAKLADVGVATVYRVLRENRVE